MTKRVIACLAALTLALSLLPVTALAEEDVVVSGEESGTAQTEEGSTSERGSTKEGETTPTTTNVAKIDDTEYETLDAAIAAAKDDDTITLLADCEITIGTIDKPVTISGNGHTVDIPPQEVNENGDLQYRLSVNSALTFNNTVVSFHNDKEGNNVWSAVFSRNGSLTLDGKSVCTVKYSGFYTAPGATINVLGGSFLTISDTHYTAMMAEYKDDQSYAVLNVTGSTFLLKDTAKNNCTYNGITTFKIYVTNSNFTIKNCDNQGLVHCWLYLDGSTANISDNDMGMTCYNNTEGLVMTNRSTLTMANNNSSGIFMYGGKALVESGSELTITGTGNTYTGNPAYYTGAIAVRYSNSASSANVTFADGAIVNIVDNPLGGFNSDGTVSLGDTTVIMNNGSKVKTGGGINTRGPVTMAEGVKLYNNHAATAGDDIYVTTRRTKDAEDADKDKRVTLTGSIALASVGSNWTLDDCNHRIDGWYLDGQEKTETKNDANEVVTTPIRWNGKTTKDGLCLEGRDEYYKLYAPTKEAVSAPLALKAAHGYLNNNPPVIRDQYYTVTVNYVDEAGNTIAPSYTTDSLKSGTAYDVTAQDAIAIPGYSYKTTTGDPTTGTLNGNKVVTVVYTKTADIDDGNTPTDPGDPGSDIDDPNTPTSPAEPPKTGDMMPLFAALTTLSAAAIVLLAKKREEA